MDLSTFLIVLSGKNKKMDFIFLTNDLFGEFFSSLFRSLNIIFFIIWEYLLILPKNLEMPSRGTPKIPRFKINASMYECCCPFFIFCLFLAFQRKVRILTTQKSLTTMHLVNFYRWFQSTTLSDHLSFFSLVYSSL